jgi:hypothetical protein
VIIYFCSFHGGTDYTLWRCIKDSKPYVLIDASITSADLAAKLIANFVRKHNIDVLNVAGPRKSEWPEGYDYTFRGLDGFLKSITSESMSRSKR